MSARRRVTTDGRSQLDKADELLTSTASELEGAIRLGLRMGLPSSIALEPRRRLAAARRALDINKLIRARAVGVSLNRPDLVDSCNRNIERLRKAPLTLAEVPKAPAKDRAGAAKERIRAILEKLIAGDVSDPRVPLLQLQALLPKALQGHEPSARTMDPEDAFGLLTAEMHAPDSDPEAVAGYARGLAEALGIDLEAKS